MKLMYFRLRMDIIGRLCFGFWDALGRLFVLLLCSFCIDAIVSFQELVYHNPPLNVRHEMLRARNQPQTPPHVAGIRRIDSLIKRVEVCAASGCLVGD